MEFKRKEMVGWYKVKQLATVGLKALVSSLFGNYADRRELQAALSGSEVYDFSESDDIWFDYVADIGDGFNSTYSVATLLAKEELNLDGQPTGRGEILIMGGDQVYPTPEIEQYDNRLRGPYQAAFPQCQTAKQPALFAIPGNHDWYDGLTNFLKVFCQGRHIGNWKTQQKRSYFAVKLPHRYWIWGIDIQLNSDVDQPQKNYFRDVAEKDMEPGDKVILCTAEPSWVFKDRYRMDESFDRLKFFENKFIHHYHFQLVATLSGDLHHYSRYAEMVNGLEKSQRITAGGGGAFANPTHNLNKKLTKIEEEDLELKAVFPDIATSRKLAFRNLLFPFYNLSFAFFLGVFYLLLSWVMETDAIYISSYAELLGGYAGESLMYELSHIESLEGTMRAVFRVMIHSPLSFILCTLLVVGFTLFSDSHVGKIKNLWISGIVHGLAQLVTCVLLLWLFSVINLKWLELPLISIPQVSLFIVEMLVLGSIAGGIIMGIYLLVSSLVLGMHDTEAFSALRCPDYKNFLRFHLTKKELRIYPVGIKKVVTNWENISKNKEQPRFKGDPVQAHLIEEPIIIKNTLHHIKKEVVKT